MKIKTEYNIISTGVDGRGKKTVLATFESEDEAKKVKDNYTEIETNLMLVCEDATDFKDKKNYKNVLPIIRQILQLNSKEITAFEALFISIGYKK